MHHKLLRPFKPAIHSWLKSPWPWVWAARNPSSKPRSLHQTIPESCGIHASICSELRSLQAGIFHVPTILYTCVRDIIRQNSYFISQSGISPVKYIDYIPSSVGQDQQQRLDNLLQEHGDRQIRVYCQINKRITVLYLRTWVVTVSFWCAKHWANYLNPFWQVATMHVGTQTCSITATDLQAKSASHVCRGPVSIMFLVSIRM